MEKGKSIYLTKEQIEQIQVVISYHVEGLPYSDFYKEENEITLQPKANKIDIMATILSQFNQSK